MERRCVVCGQEPTSTFTYPQNEKQALKWQKMLAVFVPVDVLMNHCCVCNKHINGSQEERIDNVVGDVMSPQSMQVDETETKTFNHSVPSTHVQMKGGGISAEPILNTLNQNEPQPNTLHESLSPRSKDHGQGPVNVLIMGGSMLPSYYNNDLTEKFSDMSQICVLETDFTKERATFPDIDVPNYTICQPYDQNQYSYNEKAQLPPVLLMGIAPEMQCICNKEAPESEYLQATSLVELECLLAKQNEIQLSIQKKLNELLANTKAKNAEQNAIPNESIEKRGKQVSDTIMPDYSTMANYKKN